MDDFKEIAVAWGIALVLLGLGVGVAEFSARQPHEAGVQNVVHFAAPLPQPRAPSRLDPPETDIP